MNAHLRILLMPLVLLCACSERLPKEHSEIPDRPDGAELFYNDSDISDIRRMAYMSMERAKELTGIEFAMVFLKSLPENYTLEQYAVDLMESWRIGQEFDGKGVLFLFVEDRGEMKIEVSYELEPIFTDAFCKSYQETIKTYFASQHFGDVVTNSINNMTKHYLGEPTKTLDFVAMDVLGDESGEFLSGGAGIVERHYIYDKDAKLAKIRSVDAKTLARFDASPSLNKSISNYLDSLDVGIGHPDLDVVTAGSRYKRIEYPKTPDYLQRSYREYMEAMPYRVIQKGDLAAVRFEDDKAFPMLLVRCSDGKWRLDEPKSWGLSQGSSDFGHFYVIKMASTHPWAFAFPDQLSLHGRFPVEFYVSPGEDPAPRIQSLTEQIEQNPQSAELRLLLAKVLYWECYLILAAIEAAEQATEIDPDFEEAHWFAINARYRAPALEGIQEHYKSLMRLNPEDSRISQNYEWFMKTTGN